MKVVNLFFKIAKEILEERYAMVQQEFFPIDFIGAAQSEREERWISLVRPIIYLSSDEDDYM